MAQIRKDLYINFRSMFSFFIVSFWVFLSLIVALYVITSNGNLVFSRLLVYNFLEVLMEISVLLFLIPAILIPVEYESGMINIYKGLGLPFNVIFTSKLISMVINFLILEILSLVIFFIVYVSSNTSSVNASIIEGSFQTILTALLSLTFVFLPVIGYISIVSYASSKRWVSILVSTLIFLSMLFGIENIAPFYETSFSNGTSAIYPLPSIYYPLFVSFPVSSISILAEAFRIPVIDSHTLGGVTIISPPLFHAFLSEAGYTFWISFFAIIFLFLSYLVGRLRYYYG